MPGPNPWHAWRGHCPPYTDELVWPLAVTLTGSMLDWPSNAKYGCVSGRRDAAHQGSEAHRVDGRPASAGPRTGERRSRRGRRRGAERAESGVSCVEWRMEDSVRGRGVARNGACSWRASSVRTGHVTRSTAQSQTVIRDARRRRTSVRHRRSVDQGTARAIGGAVTGSEPVAGTAQQPGFHKKTADSSVKSEEYK